MSSSTPQKFGFDTVFDGVGGATSPIRPKRLFTAEEVEQARVEAHAAGERQAMASAEALQAQALAHVANLLQQAMPSLAAVAHEHRAGSAELALACGRAIADAALDRFPEAALQAALESLAREIETAPRVLIAVAPKLVDALTPLMHETAQRVGYAGSVVVRGDPRAASAAFTLDFGDGAASFDPKVAAERVSAALASALAAEGLHAEPLALGGEMGA